MKTIRKKLLPIAASWHWIRIDFSVFRSGSGFQIVVDESGRKQPVVGGSGNRKNDVRCAFRRREAGPRIAVCTRCCVRTQEHLFVLCEIGVAASLAKGGHRWGIRLRHQNRLLRLRNDDGFLRESIPNLRRIRCNHNRAWEGCTRRRYTKPRKVFFVQCFRDNQRYRIKMKRRRSSEKSGYIINIKSGATKQNQLPEWQSIMCCLQTRVIWMRSCPLKRNIKGNSLQSTLQLQETLFSTWIYYTASSGPWFLLVRIIDQHKYARFGQRRIERYQYKYYHTPPSNHVAFGHAMNPVAPNNNGVIGNWKFMEVKFSPNNCPLYDQPLSSYAIASCPSETVGIFLSKRDPASQPIFHAIKAQFI